MRDSVSSARYSSVCNVLRLWNILLIPTYRVYLLYDYVELFYAYSDKILARLTDVIKVPRRKLVAELKLMRNITAHSLLKFTRIVNSMIRKISMKVGIMAAIEPYLYDSVYKHNINFMKDLESMPCQMRDVG